MRSAKKKQKGAKRTRSGDLAKLMRHAANPFGQGGPARVAAVARVGKPSEKKNIDTNVATAAPGLTTDLAMSPLSCINACTAGALAQGQRIGRQIQMKSILLRGRIHIQAGQTGVAFFRTVVIYDRESNGTTPAITDVFKLDAIWSPNNLGNSWRFKILADVKHEQGMSPDDNEGYLYERYIKCNLPARYIDGAGAGTAADIVEGSLWVATWCGGVSCATAAPMMNIFARVRYEDN